VSISTGADCPLPRVKPFKYSYEKEIVLYAHFTQLPYFSTECVYAPFAYRGFARDFIKQAESIRSTAIVDMVRSGEELVVSEEVRRRRGAGEDGKGRLRLCSVCGYLSSNELCKACVLLQGLNKGRARRTVEPEGAEVERKEKKKEESDGVGSINEQSAGRAGGGAGGWEQAIDVNAAVNRQEVSAVFGRLRQSRNGHSRGSRPFIIAEQINGTSW
jgi:cytoplasmic tRNA 2-thiolation protein 1